MRNKQTGFTLIELVMVIVILGILAATALPKFVNLGADARISVIKGVEGSMRAANSIIYAKAATANKMGPAGAAMLVNINGTDVLLDYGFAKDTTELLKVMDLSPATDFDTATANVIGHKGAQATTNCRVTYTAATAAAAPVYTLDVTNCN